jgi:hypothetical protein
VVVSRNGQGLAAPDAGPAAGVPAWIAARVARDPALQVAAARQPLDPGASAPEASEGGDDVLDVLTREHDHLQALVKELLAGPAGPGRRVATAQRRRRGELARLVAARLRRHEAAEQQHLWPAVRDALADGPTVVGRALEQERRARDVVARLLEVEPGTPRFDDLAGGLETALRQHVAFEDTVFLRLRDALPVAARTDLGRRVLGSAAGDHRPPTVS